MMMHILCLIPQCPFSQIKRNQNPFLSVKYDVICCNLHCPQHDATLCLATFADFTRVPCFGKLRLGIVAPVSSKSAGFLSPLSVDQIVVENLELNPALVHVPRPFGCQQYSGDGHRELVVKLPAHKAVTDHCFRPTNHLLLPKKVERRDVKKAVDCPEL